MIFLLVIFEFIYTSVPFLHGLGNILYQGKADIAIPDFLHPDNGNTHGHSQPAVSPMNDIFNTQNWFGINIFM